MNKVTLDYGGALDYGVPAGTYYADPAGEIAALTAKLEAAEKDAARLRFIVDDQFFWQDIDMIMCRNEDLRAAVDKAMGEVKNED